MLRLQLSSWILQPTGNPSTGINTCSFTHGTPEHQSCSAGRFKEMLMLHKRMVGLIDAWNLEIIIFLSTLQNFWIIRKIDDHNDKLNIENSSQIPFSIFLISRIHTCLLYFIFVSDDFLAMKSSINVWCGQMASWITTI